ncbi:MgtC/SapB family protein [Hufsiella ginkgonis]|uniref:MgtC/SapB family protein n=1 Tax=Hufsiella ginkgonis TaxID=2695274 RepID=A0A7K1XSE5_9SPHI|nr:MgtC/SapB family protein [Hufsiella ginkgonis]MXV13820.1 MgtC/SapB family protein [Hufsiella ginkgonis]
MIDFIVRQQEMIDIGASLVCGAMIGIEREYKNKVAGLRTMILICLGSTIFTLVSQHAAGKADDRIASNIVTGIGFIGAGVIFKDKLWVKGLTTAAVIWITAAIGMMCGTGNYVPAIILSVIVVAILSLFNSIEDFIDRIHHRKQFTITFNGLDLQPLHQLEQEIKMRKLHSSRKNISKDQHCLIVILAVYGRKKQVRNLDEYMVGLPEIKAFEMM